MDKSVQQRFDDALKTLGVTDHTLTAEEKRSLDEEGYVVFYDVVQQEWLEQMRAAFEQLILKESGTDAFVFGNESGVRRLSDLINKGEVWDGVWTHPKMLAAAYHVIGRPFKVNSINARDALPGEGHQGLHADWGVRQANEPYTGINTLWLLDDFTSSNGATRLVPGTHKLPVSIKDYMDNPEDPHPDQKILELKAGTVIAYNWHLWHGGTKNHTTLKRRVLHPSYIARDYPQQYDQLKLLQTETYERLSPAARYLLGLEVTDADPAIR